MHFELLSGADLHLYTIEHERRARVSDERRRMMKARPTRRSQAGPAVGRGWVPWLAGALGLL